MARMLSLCLLLVVLMMAGSVAAADEKDQQAVTRQVWELIRQSRTLANEGRLEDAEAALLQARASSPEYAEVYAHLGYVYELQGKFGDALHAYAELLRRRPKHEYAASRLENIFYEGAFPRSLFVEDLQFSPIHFVVDRCLLTMDSPGHESADVITPVVGIAYTDDLLFHEEMERGGPPVEVNIPVSGGARSALVNRSSYGYATSSAKDRLEMQFVLSYPSRLVSAHQTDYRETAPNIVHLMLRAYGYFTHYLGKQPPVDPPVKTYLLEDGPPGAESYGSELFFYSAHTPRTPVEWARQVGHEYGHLVLPPVGRYMQPESWANGMLGERLFIQWLAEEAQAVSGAQWPEQPAVEILDRLLGENAEFDAIGYLDASCYADMQLFQQLGPDAAQIAGTDQESMRYWLGLMLWIQATLGKETLRDVMDAAPGTSPADFLYALKLVMKQQATADPITLSAGGIDAERSRLSVPPMKGALGWRGITLSAGDSAAIMTYIPEGVWQLRVTPPDSGLTLTFDGRGPLPVDPAHGLSLGAVAEDWHTLEVGNQGEPVELQSIQLMQAGNM